MKEIDKRGMKLAIKVKETFRIEVRDELRKRSKEYSERRKIYKERNRIESVFGNVKIGGRSYFDTKIEKACKDLCNFVFYSIQHKDSLNLVL